jgi:hypothetical protein
MPFIVAGHAAFPAHQPTAASRYSGSPWETNEDWPATSS